MPGQDPLSPRKVFELDLLRVTTSLGVVLCHVLSCTDALYATTLGPQVHGALAAALHYSRNVFAFVTAFALVHVYSARPFSPGCLSAGRGWS